MLRPPLFLLMMLLFCTLSSNAATSKNYKHMKAPALSLSAEEKAFIKNHPEIRVSNEMDWPPFDYVRSGLPAGFSVDFVRLLASKVGLKIRFINGFTFTELLEQFQQRRIDLVHSVYKNPKREAYGRYSQLYYSSKSHFIIDRASPEITELADLFGKKLAVVKGWTYELLLKEKYPQIEIYPVSSVLEGLKAVDNGLADAAARCSASSGKSRRGGSSRTDPFLAYPLSKVVW